MWFYVPCNTKQMFVCQVLVAQEVALSANWALIEEECRRRSSMVPLLIVLILLFICGGAGTLYC